MGYKIQRKAGARWTDTAWGTSDEKKKSVERAEEIVSSWVNGNGSRQGIRVVDDDGNVHYEWIKPTASFIPRHYTQQPQDEGVSFDDMDFLT